MTTKMTKLERLQADVREQQTWIAACGGNLDGYVEKYGPCNKLGWHYGNGAEAIYAADTGELAIRTELLAAEVKRVNDKSKPSPELVELIEEAVAVNCTEPVDGNYVFQRLIEAGYRVTKI